MHSPSAKDPKHGNVSMAFIANKNLIQGKWHKWLDREANDVAIFHDYLEKIVNKNIRYIEKRAEILANKKNVKLAVQEKQKIISELRKKLSLFKSTGMKQEYAIYLAAAKGKSPFEAMKEIDENGHPLLKEIQEEIANEQKQLRRIRYVPHSKKFILRNELIKAGKDICSHLKNLLLGYKTPEISSKTKSNRRWRGNDSSIALNETGEFADSITYEVIAL